MATQRFDLQTEPRSIGKSTSRALRMDRKVPGVVYGAGKGNFNVSLLEGTILKYNTRAFENALFTLKSTDKALNDIVVLMKDVQVHPVSRRPEHVDLLALDMNKPVRVFIEIKFEGKPAGLADGGLLTIVNRQVEVECLPTAIPDAMSVDVSALGVGDSIHASELKFPDSVKMMSAADMTLAVVNIAEDQSTAPAAAGDAAAPAAAAAAAPAAGAKGAAPAAGAKAAAAPAAKAPQKK